MADEKQLELLEKYRDLIKDISDIEKDRLKNEGIFITKSREQLIQFQQLKDIQEGVVAAALEQDKIQDLVNQKLRKQAEQKRATTVEDYNRIGQEITRLEDNMSMIGKRRDRMFEASVKNNIDLIKDDQKRLELTARMQTIRKKMAQGKLLSPEAKKELKEVAEATKKGLEAEEAAKQLGVEAEKSFGKVANFFGLSTEFSSKS
jgi:hypothetical protein